MSTAMRRAATNANSASATSATTTVMGRLRAPKTKRMLYPRGSLAHLSNERLNIASGRRNPEQATPHSESGQHVVNLSLREQSLRFGDGIDDTQSRLITRGRLIKRGSGSRNLHRRVGGNAAGAIQGRDSPVPLCAKI